MASKKENILSAIKARLETITQVKQVLRYAPVAQAIAPSLRPTLVILPIHERIAQVDGQFEEEEARELTIGILIYGAETNVTAQDTELNNLSARVHFVLEGWQAQDGDAAKICFPLRWMETDSWWSHQAVPQNGIMSVYSTMYAITRGDPWDGDVS